MDLCSVGALEFRFFDASQSNLAEKSVVLFRQATQVAVLGGEDFKWAIGRARAHNDFSVAAHIVRGHFAPPATDQLGRTAIDRHASEIFRAVIFHQRRLSGSFA